MKAFEVTVEKDLIQPTLVFGHPIEISPLAKPMADDPRFVERFEIFIAGMECGDNWSEQNDPVHLLETWRKSYRAEDRDAGKFHTLDFDFIEALGIRHAADDRHRAGHRAHGHDFHGPGEYR